MASHQHHPIVLLSTVCTVLLLAGDAPAGERPESSARRDSAAVQYHLPEIVVTANRLPTSREETPAALTVIDKRELTLAPGVRLASILATLPGVFVRPYGGGGALQTVSFRGMAAEHTVLIIDNQRINNVQNGQADFGILSRFNLERVEVVRGGHSALYGADAMGGVVRAFTKRPTREPSLHAALGIGSAGLLSRELGFSGSVSGLGLMVAVRSEKGDGKYPYLHTDGIASTRHERLGADHDMVEAFGRLTWIILPGLDTELSFTGAEVERGVPGPVLRPDDRGGARLADESARWSWALSWKAADGLTTRLAMSLDATAQRYADPTLDLGGQGGLLSTSDLTVYRVSPEIEHVISEGLEGVLGVELQRARLSGTDVGDRDRRQWGAWYSLHFTMALGTDVLHDLSLFPSLRYDWFSDFGEAWSPKLGLSVTPFRVLPLRIRASYGKSYRAPTFNELYWIPGGNPSLEPERSTAIDAGLIATFPLAGDLRLEAGVFSGETRDRILWLPGLNAVWTPENVDNVTIRGVELEAAWLVFDRLIGLSLNSTWTDARKSSPSLPGDPTAGNQLIYVPQQTVNATVDVHAGPVDVRVQHNWVSFRYTSEANDQVLPSYGVTSASAQVRLPLAGSTVTVVGEIGNIFNESYEVMPQYPMPLRTFRVSLGVDI